MIVRTLDEIRGTEADVQAETWNSRRLLLARDGMGFSLHDTFGPWRDGDPDVLPAPPRGGLLHRGAGHDRGPGHGRGAPHRTGHGLRLDQHDEHIVRAEQTLRLVCVFNPPVTGTETHGPDGAYPPSEG